ncbi:hypothetical protein M413DRAFT_445085 [Hebeloma cylindrosporum]|uniref:F-box domain-containing protein n=1 Tax=Hebeloma cylindrosporum TaxID=76867 RepID=A0A0C3CCA3_HEBCY|nr:hypothetical protein M413DRAFT_445085 [Hebeloma cylindrosporum h7]
MLVITDPVETLEHIAAALDSPIDLAKFGAVCTRFHLLVEPYHTQFRVIRAPLLPPVWEKLVANRSLAQNVRILEVQSAELHDDDDLGSTVDAPVITTIFADLEGTPGSRDGR